MKKRIGIFCHTPFHFIEAINVAFNYLDAEECVIFPMREMLNTKNTLDISLFPPYIVNVYNVRRTPRDISTFQNAILMRVLRKKYPLFCSFEKLPPKMHFDAFVGDKYGIVLLQYAQCYGLRVPYYMVEEGIGDYYLPLTKHQISKETIRENYDNICELIHVSMLPKIIKQLNPNEEVIQAPFLKQNSIASGIILAQFLNERRINIPNKSCVYFLQPGIENMPQEKEIIGLLQNSFSNLLLKPHPRQNIDVLSQYELMEFLSPWEIVPLVQDISQLILISSNSTALLTPKLLYDQEPYLLILDNIFSNSQNDDIFLQRRNQLFTEIRNKYKHKERVYIPQNREELIQSIESLKTAISRS